MKETWDERIERAEALAGRSDGAKELLAFYGRLLRAQKEIYEYLRSRRGWLPSGELEQDLPVLRVMMPMLLRVVESSGPEALAGEARGLLRASESEIDGMLLGFWFNPSDMHFFAKAFLQPYARWLAETGARHVRGQPSGAENRCPFCGGRPQLTFLESAAAGADGGARRLMCATCLTAWPFRRIGCANCDEERPAKLGVFHSPAFDNVRVEACDTCRHYIKGIDLTRLGLAVPLVDEVAAAPLDLWAVEHGYTKIELNLVGL
jgi:FdhE protein